MAGIKDFQVDRNKYTSGLKDINKIIEDPDLTTEVISKDSKLRNGFKVWTSFFRENPHRFAEDYLGLKLHLFQRIILFMAFHSDVIMYLAARGQGKSFLIAIISIIRCILFPGTKILIASGTKNQARLIITQKIEKELRLNYPNIAREIKDVKTSLNECLVVFHNGSTIEAVTSNDNARGYRANILILDEFRLIDEDVVTKVLRPFLNVNRQPAYLKKKEYAHLQEENIEIYLSSAWYRNHWAWDKFKAFTKSMCEGKDYFVCALDYNLSMHHGLLTEKRVNQIKSEDDFDPISWMMEYECLFFGESEHSFYKLNDIQKNRTLLKAFYPINNIDYVRGKNRQRKSNKQNGEFRIIGADIAMMGGQQNDLTVFTCMRLIPNRDEYIRQVVYIETLSGAHSQLQAIRLKELYEDFEADFVAIDCQGNGLSLYDDCARVLYDSERDVEYPAWCAMNNQEMADRALDRNALPVIYSIKVVSREVNHEIAMYLKTCLEKGKIKLLIDETRGREFLLDNNKEYIKKSAEDQAYMTSPYLQTTSLVNELVNLEYEINNGFVKLKETGSRRKDRYSSIAYCNYYSKILELSLMQEDSDYEFDFQYS
jgi:hypothetical protein